MSADRELEAASDILWQCWQDNTVIDELPEELRPVTRADGYAIQAQLMRLTWLPLFGWKIAATSVAGQKHINVDGPLAGRILTDRVVANGAALTLGANRMRVAEAEFAFRMGEDLHHRPEGYSEAEVLAAVDTLHPSIEVPDSRFSNYTKVGAAQLIADNACADDFMLGPAAPADWRKLDLAAHQVVGRVPGRGVMHNGQGANVLGGPLVALTWLVNELSSLRITLKAGEMVTTGTCIVPLPLEVGDEAVADFGVLGKVSLNFV